MQLKQANVIQLNRRPEIIKRFWVLVSVQIFSTKILLRTNIYTYACIQLTATELQWQQ